MKFTDLLRTPACGSIGDQQKQSGQRFWQELDRTGIGHWEPGGSIPTSGLWLLIGLAPSWSTYDLELVDSIVERVTDPKRTVQVGFFDVSGVHDQADIDLYIPGLKKFYQTPVVGLWKDGQLIESGEGERRVGLVALTPAKHYVYPTMTGLYYTVSRSQFWLTEQGSPSRTVKTRLAIASRSFTHV